MLASDKKMNNKIFTKNVSETHNLNNPTQGTQCGAKTNSLKTGVSERRDLYLS